MERSVPESDWKMFRVLRVTALERLCERTLREVAALSGAAGRTHHERYLEVYRHIDTCDDQLARAFNGASRSQMINQLAQMVALDLIGDEELAAFSTQTRTTIDLLTRRSR